jgi:peptidoglycan biosynthesis protein MviN/MurJ (putative lipid II flippase)
VNSVAAGRASVKSAVVSERKISFSMRCVGIARAILHDRTVRRKWLSQMLMLALGLMAVGLWGLSGWLQAEVLRFVLWWGACGLITIFVMLFALYDLLMVFREERGDGDSD